ncbi:acyl-CoA thioester hydrolase [Pseudarcicella hirudinis]|uniref:Acyl-CoA thioester hydrolase n=1 Tax=Pseudarcicella hirudinis TaxID=1079859 RepID=A0A1I5WMZ4_9BACT|nr:acyl-CoA thioesterase [Pseudarcicella hirudinis]SFQ21060.1 acyl-CoA thioester hydrolase [Pseudarcicella hirudinis]
MFNLDPDKTYPKKLYSKSVIRFQDCDPLKHLNNAKYFDYFFNAREDQVAAVYKFDYNDYFEHNMTSWVVYNHQIAYINSAKVSEWVTIISSVIYFNENTMVTECVMTDESRQVLKAVIWTTSKYIDVLTGKKTDHQPEVTKFLETICAEGIDFENITFNSRIKIIKQELKDGTFI